MLPVASRRELEHRAACYSRPFKRVQRARLALYAAEGKGEEFDAGGRGGVEER